MMWKDQDGFEISYTAEKAKTIPVESKISFKRYMKICWENSRTNLHYIDFCRKWQPVMKRMFRPIKVFANKPRQPTR